MALRQNRIIPAASAAFVWLLLFLAASPAYALEANSQPTQTFEQRRQAVLSQLYAAGPSERVCPDTPDLRRECGLLPKLGFGLGALYRAHDRAEIDAGNTAIREVATRLFELLGSKKSKTSFESSSDRFYNRLLVPFGLLTRVYFLFSDEGTFQAGRLAKHNQQQIPALLWNFVRSRCRITDTDRLHTWRIPRNESENHHSLRINACWAAAAILSRSSFVCGDCKYDDGSGPKIQLSAWTEYLKEYIRQRPKYGGFTEFFSPTYYKYTLMNVYNLGDFSADAELRKLATSLLDVWFAEWAEEQIEGIHGGSKTRFYFDSIGKVLVGSELGWLYFGLGSMHRGNYHPGLMAMTTSQYRPPDLVSDIATDVTGRGKYEVRSRRPGLLRQTGTNDIREVDAAAGGIVRYTYVTPSFAMGTTMVAKVPTKNWEAGSAQNRWSGLVLAGDRERHLFAYPANSNSKGGTASTYNVEWGVQHKGTQIVQKLASPYGSRSGNMTVWIGGDLVPQREGDWVFFESSAYVAVRPVFGRLVDHVGPPRGLALTEDFSPIILYAADRSDFQNFESFKQAVKSAPLATDGHAILFRAPRDGAAITFFYNSERLPEIDGVPINLAPPYAFDSPFIQARWGEGLITIRKGSAEIVRDFRN
jgi:hypothetical protein